MKKNSRTHFMASLLLIIFSILFLLVMGRFVYIQAKGEVNNVSLQKWAQEKREVTHTLKAERGKVFDSNGKLLAYDRSLYRIYAIVDETYTQNKNNPKHVVNSEEVGKHLSTFINLSAEEITSNINEAKSEGRFQVEFGLDGRNITKQTKEEIEKLHLPGIYFLDEAVRYYPNGMFASHIIGFTQNTDDEKTVGMTGVEAIKDELLSGSDGYITYERDRYDKKLLNTNELVKKAKDGHDIYLTIDQKIQILLEDVLAEVDDKYSPKRITAVVMNPKTGEILAMSNRPSYDPNNPGEVENWYNDVISSPFEPGSTVKMFTWAAAIDSGVYNGNELYQSGSYRIHEKVRPINDHNGGRGWGPISYNEGFLRSSNVAASKLVWEKMGPDQFYDYIKAFHFDEKTGIDLPSEIAGQILYNYPAEKLTTSFGQGGTLTPIQQMKAATAIANEGKMMRPYVVKKIVDTNKNEVIEEKQPEIVGEPIKKETAEQVLNLLHDVVNDDRGTGKPYRLKDYSVAGKTGTAEIPNPNGSGYLTGHGNSVYSFLGMAPKDDPQIMMLVAVNQPNISYEQSGSDVVSYIFNGVMENSLRYLNIAPDIEKNDETVETITMPDVIDKNKVDVDANLHNLGVNYTIIGDGKKIVSANILADEQVFKDTHIILITDRPLMPNLIGWSKRDIFQLGDLLNIDTSVKGSGYVSKQNIKQGESLKDDTKIEVELNTNDKKNDK